MLGIGPVRLRDVVFSLVMSGVISLFANGTDQFAAQAGSSDVTARSRLVISYIRYAVPVFYLPCSIHVALGTPSGPDEHPIDWHTI